MAHSYVDARLQAHGYLLAHGMLSDKFLTIRTPSDNNNSIERTPTAHRCLLAHRMVSDRLLTIGTPHGCLLIHTDGS